MSFDIQPIVTVPGMGRSLIAHDPESRNFPVRGFLTEPTLKRVTRSWRRGSPPYDQGQASSCVGQALKGVLNTSPSASLVASKIRTGYSANGFYLGGQNFDEWPGGEPDYQGTSALGVCKYLVSQNIITEYRWCFGIDDVLDTLSQHGPVAVGLKWTRDMTEPDSNGFIAPNGEEIGGHETELLGINVKGGYVTGENSWGVNWGLKGRFKIRFTDLNTLLKDDGDAVTVVSVVPS